MEDEDRALKCRTDGALLRVQCLDQCEAYLLSKEGLEVLGQHFDGGVDFSDLGGELLLLLVFDELLRLQDKEAALPQTLIGLEKEELNANIPVV